MVMSKFQEHTSSAIIERLQAIEQYFNSSFPQKPILPIEAISREAIYDAGLRDLNDDLIDSSAEIWGD